MGKWKEFKKRLSYRIIDLGRPAVFFIPAQQLSKKVRGKTLRAELHEFLVKHFSAYTTSRAPSVGFYRAVSKQFVTDACVVYEVSFLGKQQIPVLLEKLAWVAVVSGEECIYFKAGQYTCLVYPAKHRRTLKKSSRKRRTRA